MKNADLQAWETGRDCSFVSEPDVDGLMVSSDLDERGRELPDPVPTAPPVGYSSGPSLADFVQRMIQNEVSRMSAQNGMETFQEADDFDIEDDPTDPETPYEEYFDPRVKMSSFDPRYKAAFEAFIAANPPEAFKKATEQGGGGSAAPLAADPNKPPEAAPKAP